LADTEFGVQFLENANERLSRQSILHATGMVFIGVIARVRKRLILDAEKPSCSRTKDLRAFWRGACCVILRTNSWAYQPLISLGISGSINRSSVVQPVRAGALCKI
jgi:hypothetical protein